MIIPRGHGTPDIYWHVEVHRQIRRFMRDIRASRSSHASRIPTARAGIEPIMCELPSRRMIMSIIVAHRIGAFTAIMSITPFLRHKRGVVYREACAVG